MVRSTFLFPIYSTLYMFYMYTCRFSKQDKTFRKFKDLNDTMSLNCSNFYILNYCVFLCLYINVYVYVSVEMCVHLHPDSVHAIRLPNTPIFLLRCLNVSNVYTLPSQELNVLRPKAGFRLWLTAEIHPRFPPILLQSSLKITYEVVTHTNPHHTAQVSKQ